MNDVMRELDEAFALLSAIPVAFDNVDRMAMAKEHLRRAYKLAEKKGGSVIETGTIRAEELGKIVPVIFNDPPTVKEGESNG